MEIAGLQKLTLIDFPGRIAATVFTRGCNFHCGFCHNKELVDSRYFNQNLLISEETFFRFLDKRKDFLEGVCLTGGEPTIQPDLPLFIKKIKSKKLAVKLDTNGSRPDVLKNLIEDCLVDYLAMDVKVPFDKYKLLVDSEQLIENVNQSISLLKSLKSSTIDYEFRTTIVPGLIQIKDIKEIGKWIQGAKLWALQQFKPFKTLNKNFEKLKPYSDKIMNEFLGTASIYVQKAELRNL